MKFTHVSLCKILEQHVPSMSLGNGSVTPRMGHCRAALLPGDACDKGMYTAGPSFYHPGETSSLWVRGGSSFACISSWSS